MRVVIDASVAVNWILPDREGEQDATAALRLLSAVADGTIEAMQPPHWLIEVAAVVARLAPAQAEAAVRLLDALELRVVDDPETLVRACALASELDHHLFDTLYHSVALGPGDDATAPTFVTCDVRYYRKARHKGRIALLSSWPVTGT